MKGHRFLGIAVAAVLLGIIVFTKRLRTTPERVYEPRPPAAILAAQPFRFVEEAERLGLRYQHLLYYPNPAAGSYLPLMAFPPAVAVADFDGDGFMDVYVVQPEPGQPNRLYRNVHGDHFEDVAGDVGLADTNKRFAGSMAVWADFNGDGLLDLFQARFGCHSLFLRDPGPRVHFTEHPELTRFACSNPKAVNVGDMNRDGWPDVVLGNYYPATNLATYLPVNHVFGYVGANYQGGGAEVLLGSPRGFVQAFRGPSAHTQAIGLSDVDGDGWPDLFASNDYTYDQMFLDKGGRSFVEVTDEYIPRVEHGLSGMDADFADFDNAGAMSLYVSNMYFPPFATTKNLLWKKKPDGRFVNVAGDLGVARCGWAWTGKFADFDNSGDLDLFVVNGKARGARVTTEAEATRSFAFVRNSIMASPPGLRQRMSLVPDFSGFYLSAFERSCLFWNHGGRFYDVATEAGIGDREEGQSAALVDFDNDGRVDVVVANLGGPLLAYHNVTPAAGHWLGVDLRGRAGGAPYGAKVFLHREDGKTPMREYYPANGYRGQSDPRMHFGLGAAARAPDLEVRWPDGRIETFAGLPVDGYSIVRYGGGIAR